MDIVCWLRKPSMGAVMVARLLRADPEGWSGDRHVLSHLGSKINIWVAMKARTKILGKPQDHEVITAAFAALNGIEPEKGDE